MLYFKVKEQYDNFNIFKNGKFNIALVSNELFTEKELLKNNIPVAYTTKIEIPKTQTYFMFGARFQLNNVYDFNN